MQQQDIAIFLSKVKSLIRKGNFRFLSERNDRDYLDDLGQLDLTEGEAIEHILNIKPAMYWPDEKPQYAQTSNTLIFKKRIKKNVAYIKLHINEYEVMVECFSFHKDYDRRKEYGM